MKNFIALIFILIGLGDSPGYTQISIIGTATPSGNWTNDHNLTETFSGSGIWTGTFTLSANELKFRENGSWTNNWGSNSFPSGTGTLNGPNIPVSPAGTYFITFSRTTLEYSFINPGRVGIGTASPSQKLDVNGKIRINDDTLTPGPGTVRWNNNARDFEGYDGTAWRSLTNANISPWGTNDISVHENLVKTASDGAAYDHFGRAVSISGDYAIISAIDDDIEDNIDQGSAYIFVRNGSSWTQQAKLTAADGAGGFFGQSVSIDGDYAIVGAYADESLRGSAYIFVRNGTNWSQQAKLLASDGTSGDFFGYSVSISGNYAIVGAYGDNSYSGSAYIYKRVSVFWSEQAKLTASDGAAYDDFGISVAIDGDYAIIGADSDDIGSQASQGSAYIFYRSGNTWSEQAKLTASDGAAYDEFGNSVAINGDYAIVGVYMDDIGSQVNQGSAYIFYRSGNTWSEQVKLLSSEGASGDYFGFCVAINENHCAIGAYGDNSYKGSVYVFVRSSAEWTQQVKLTPYSANGNWFCYSVSIGTDHVIAGLPGENIGSNAEQGSVYFFRKN